MSRPHAGSGAKNSSAAACTSASVASSEIGNGTYGAHFERPPVLIPRSCTSRPCSSRSTPCASTVSRAVVRASGSIGAAQGPSVTSSPVVGAPVSPALDVDPVDPIDPVDPASPPAAPPQPHSAVHSSDSLRICLRDRVDPELCDPVCILTIIFGPVLRMLEVSDHVIEEQIAVRQILGRLV